MASASWGAMLKIYGGRCDTHFVDVRRLCSFLTAFLRQIFDENVFLHGFCSRSSLFSFICLLEHSDLN